MDTIVFYLILIISIKALHLLFIFHKKYKFNKKYPYQKELWKNIKDLCEYLAPIENGLARTDYATSLLPHFSIVRIGHLSSNLREQYSYELFFNHKSIAYISNIHKRITKGPWISLFLQKAPVIVEQLKKERQKLIIRDKRRSQQAWKENKELAEKLIGNS